MEENGIRPVLEGVLLHSLHKYQWWAMAKILTHPPTGTWVVGGKSSLKIVAWATQGQGAVSMITHCFSGKLGMEKGPFGAYPELNLEPLLSLKNY